MSRGFPYDDLLYKAASEQVRAFIATYMPVLPSDREGYFASPHGLLYDFHRRYDHVTFTVDQLLECLADYLKLIDPVLQFFDSIPPERQTAGYLYGIDHIDASQLVMSYLRRTALGDRIPEYCDFLSQSDAISRLDEFLKIVDPMDEYPPMDVVSRIQSVRYGLLKFIERSC